MKKELLILDDTWINLNDVAIYGFGKIAQGMIDLFIDMFHVEYIIDNGKKEKEYRNIPIISFDIYKRNNSGKKIIVLTGKKAFYLIKKELVSEGYVEYKDFCDIDTFYEDWFGNYMNKVCIGRVIFSVTTFCTLNCKKCNMLTPYNKNKRNYDLQMLENDVDALFSSLDYVSNLVLVGGEPFLYPQLEELVIYIGKEYQSEIGNFQIITNGMLIPSAHFLNIIKENNVEIRISDYTQAIDYSKKKEELCCILKEKKIRYILFEQNEWLDFGFPEEDLCMGNTRDEIRRHMIECQPMCPLVHDKKMYYCSSSWAAQEAGLYTLEQGDWINLEENTISKRKNLLDFYLGKSEKGYISFCKKCRGFAGNDHVICPGEQF